MLKFSRPLERGIHPNTGKAVFGFSINDFFIFDPFISECGRFQADPTQTYGLAKEEADQLVALNKALDEATEAATNEGCRILQQALGVQSGDVAATFFSGEKEGAVSEVFADYAECELRLAEALER